jgi:hypothetical protein
MMFGALALGLVLVGCDGAATAPRSSGGSSRTTPRKAPASDARPSSGPRVLIEGPDGSVAVRVEIAKDPPTRERGLMFRRQMDEDAGMIFLFEAPQVQVFWMKNTYLPLDMIFIGEDMRVAGIVENAEPLTETGRQVELPSLYVLEVNAGFSRRHGIGPGAPVRFEGVQ